VENIHGGWPHTNGATTATTPGPFAPDIAGRKKKKRFGKKVGNQRNIRQKKRHLGQGNESLGGKVPKGNNTKKTWPFVRSSPSATKNRENKNNPPLDIGNDADAPPWTKTERKSG